MKRIVTACIDELLKFDDQSEADIFLRRRNTSHAGIAWSACSLRRTARS